MTETSRIFQVHTSLPSWRGDKSMSTEQPAERQAERRVDMTNQAMRKDEHSVRTSQPAQEVPTVCGHCAGTQLYIEDGDYACLQCGWRQGAPPEAKPAWINTIPCAWCGSEFAPRHPAEKYCSSICRHEKHAEQDREYCERRRQNKARRLLAIGGGV